MSHYTSESQLETALMAGASASAGVMTQQRFREPVVLCYLEGLTSEQAAARIGCPPGTVRSRLSRARERLRVGLVRRGVALPAALLAAGLMAPASAALPVKLLDATVRVSLGFAGRRATEAAMASAPAITLARWVLYAMTISRLKFLGAAALACVLALGGAQTLTSGQAGGLTGRQEPAAAAPGGDDSYTALSRSVDQFERKMDETDRRNAEIRKELQDIQTRLKVRRAAPVPAPLSDSSSYIVNHEWISVATSDSPVSIPHARMRTARDPSAALFRAAGAQLMPGCGTDAQRR